MSHQIYNFLIVAVFSNNSTQFNNTDASTTTIAFMGSTFERKTLHGTEIFVR